MVLDALLQRHAHVQRFELLLNYTESVSHSSKREAMNRWCRETLLSEKSAQVSSATRK